MAKVTRPDGYAVTFAYDALGRRVSKRFRGKVTHWVWDGDKPLHEWTELEVGPGAGSAGEVLTWLFEEDSFAPLAKLTKQGAYSVVCDHLGTPLSLHDAQGVTTWDPSLTVGLPFTPRWALQVGFSYHGKRETIDNPNSTVEATVRTKYFLVPALLRYTVTAPTNPVQFDVLGGATLVHAKGRTTYSPPFYDEPTISDTRFNLTLGPAVRAAISNQLEFTASSLVSVVVGKTYYNFSDRLFLNTSLGLNYKFG